MTYKLIGDGQLSILMSLNSLIYIYTINPKVIYSDLKSLVEMGVHLEWHISSWHWQKTPKDNYKSTDKCLLGIDYAQGTGDRIKDVLGPAF